MINLKGRDLERRWYSVSQLLLFYFIFLFFGTCFETDFMCLCGLFSYFGWGKIFSPILQMFCTSQ
jgi:hypothetical protein